MQKVISLLKELLKDSDQDIPIASAILDNNNDIISIEKNRKELLSDPTAHAEILAIRCASKTLNNWYLDNYTILTTLEPCPMCYQAILEARISKIIYLTKDTKNGFLNGQINYHDIKTNKPKPEVVFYDEPWFKKRLQDFFKSLRTK